MNTVLIPLLYSIKRLKKDFIGSLLIGLWLPFFALIINNGLFDVSNYILILVNLITFFIIYEIGYLISDNIGYLFENEKIRQTYSVGVSSVPLVIAGIILRLVIGIMFILLFRSLFVESVAIGYVIIMTIFIIHSFLKEKFRLATIVGLRTLKVIIPYMMLFSFVSLSAKFLILAGTVGSAIYHSIPYTVRKLQGKTKVDLNTINNSVLRLFLVFILVAIFHVIYPLNLYELLIFTIIVILHHFVFIGLRKLTN